MIETERLILRPWREEDRAPFALLNADPVVRRFFPGVLARAESDRLVDRLIAAWADDGYAFGAVELKGQGFVGMCGLAVVDDLPPAPAVEIGWRFARAQWGQGYATEAALGWLGHGFGALALDEVIAFAAAGNEASFNVMRRIGMRPDPMRDFDHPKLAEASPVRRQQVWRIVAGSPSQ